MVTTQRTGNHGDTTRRRGRPRVEQAAPLERVSTRLPLPYYDRLVALAGQRDQSVASVVRELLILRIDRTAPADVKRPKETPR